MKPIKVLYYYSSSQIDTGSPRAMLRMIDSLDRTRFYPAFIASGEGTLIEELRKRNVEIVVGEVSSTTWKNPIALAAHILEKRRLLRKFAVDLVHMNEPGWNSDIVLAARSAKIPVILHFHNQGSISGNNLNYAIARKVFLCSAAQSGEITNFDRIKDKSIVLHNAVDTRVFANGHAIRDEIGIMKNDLAVGTIAQISHRKGIDLFLDTAERLIGDYPNLKFVIVGPSAVREDAYSKSIMERIQNPPLKGIVIYLGSRTDIPNILASLDIFFLPTRAEPFGMVVIEAMAAGVPVVASAVGGIPEIITRSDIGSAVSTLTAEAYAKAIRELLQLGGALKDVGELGRQSLVGRFDLAKMRHTLSAVYEELVQR